MTTSDRRFPFVLTAAALIAFAILCGLGTWQVQRLAWKRDMIARIDAARAAPPAPLATVLGRAGPEADYARVSVQCPGLDRGRFVEIFSLIEGDAGVRLVSACRLEGAPYGAILVDRGFVADTISARPPVGESTTPVAVTGVLRLPEAPGAFTAPREAGGLFHSREVAPIAAALDAPRPAPWFLMAETSSNPEWLALKPAPLPTALSNRHLEYAVTWYGLAAALAAVYGALLFRRLRGRP